MAEQNQNEPPSDTPPDPVAERVALEREVLDPSTELERLYEILEQSKMPADSGADAYGIEVLNTASDKKLLKLLRESSTPLEALEDIDRIIKERKAGKPLPQAGE